MEFNAARMKYARVKSGLTLADLSSLLQVTSRTLSKYENGHEIPKEETIEKMSLYLRVPISFFYQDDLPEIELDRVSFRSLARKSATQVDKALCFGQLAIQLSLWLEKNFSLPSPQLPDYKHLSPKVAASALRNEWKLGEKSISNMIHLLESKGIYVFLIYEENKEIDAFCFRYAGRPFVFLNKYKSAERSRFDAAHELGHLILHQHGEPVGKEREKEADEFASAFLMPESSIRSQAVYMPTIDQLLMLKMNWRVSAAALLRRWYDLDLISDWIYRRLNIELSKLGYLKSEPNGIEHERSQILDKILKHLWKMKVTKSDIANNLHIYTEDVEKIMFGSIPTKEFENNFSLSSVV